MVNSRGEVDVSQVGDFHGEVCLKFPWWSSGIRWEGVPDAEVECFHELSYPGVSVLLRESVLSGSEEWALVSSARKAAEVFSFADLGRLHELLRIPQSAFLVGVQGLEDGRLIHQCFVGIAFRNSVWEIGMLRDADRRVLPAPA